MNLLPRDLTGCPYLLLAPMEGVGDRSFRRAMASIGGFHEAVRDFLRVPKDGHVKSLAKVYNARELGEMLLAPQLMGANPELMADMAIEMEKRGAHRIDLNCGCPSNTVTGRGAGSSLLQDPPFLYTVARSMAKAVKIPLTIKMRSGYSDISLFRENLLAAQESGAAYVTLHPRTKVEGYGPPARWDLIAEAKQVLKIPVVGNGDILSVDDALRMLQHTGCDALMIGRGSVVNPFLFQQIRAHFARQPFRPSWTQFVRFLKIYLADFPEETPCRMRVNKLKQLFGFLFRQPAELAAHREEILKLQHKEPEALLAEALTRYHAVAADRFNP